jgi:hypothetical protein
VMHIHGGTTLFTDTVKETSAKRFVMHRENPELDQWNATELLPPT